jgi:putative oxygen-independent coproporphyrinogen III oxidase
MISLYIHWPFCLSKCPYCDFNSHVQRHITEENWQQALVAELDRYRQLTGPRVLKSIFFGGGTPSLMAPATVGRVIEHANKLWGFDDIEITLEANPNSVESERFLDFKKAGVNRISVGIQALNDFDLKALGRQHSAHEAIKAIDVACKTFDRVSFDLIYARPHQTLKAWQTELSQALTFGTTHLSLYQLTIEAGTAFSTLYQRGDLAMPCEALSADLYDLTQDMMNAHQMPAYEISNHAKKGCESQHNLTYWNYGDYVGVGPGAHGRLTMGSKKYATQQKRAPESWYKAVCLGSGDDTVTELTPKEQAQERLMMGLRLQSGIKWIDFSEIICPHNLHLLVREGFVTQTSEFIQCTPRGRACLNAVLDKLIAF